jgi:protein TonB
LYTSLLHQHEGRIQWIALAVAVAIHAAALVVRIPEIAQELLPERKPETVIVVRRYVPPPPRVEQRQVARRPVTRKVALPDPTPDEPEPIREPEPEIAEFEPLLTDVEVLIGVPALPEVPPAPSLEPLLPGVGGVSNPVLIEETKVTPLYPELARMARVEGNVILQALIHADGSVGRLTVLRCTRPAFGFEDSAVDAVRQWRYEPATVDGRPVEVYFTVFVEFVLETG